MDAICILSTKKLQPNQKQYLLNAGLSVIEADFIEIENLPVKLENINNNLLFASQNAFRSFMQNDGYEAYRQYPVFCVGSKTREVAEAHGFVVEACADYAEQLADIITVGYKEQHFTFFSGSLRRDTLPEALANAGIKFNEIQAYRTTLTPHGISAVTDGILFFSPSGIESYLKKNTIAEQVCFCIGTTTSEALKEITGAIVTANKPSVENVIIQCINYYNDKKIS